MTGRARAGEGWVRRLDSGLWAATVYTPTGRITETDKLESVVRRWAADRMAEVRRGDWIDPRGAEATVGEWWLRVKDSRHLEKASKKRDASHWKVHVAPRWTNVPLGAILKPDISRWVVEMTEAGVGAATIEGAIGVLRALLEQAVDARVLRINPANRVKTPPRDAHIDRVLEPEEEEQLLARLDELFPGRLDGRFFVELLLDTGLRWEEAAAIHRESVVPRQGRINVAHVMERDGSIRAYAKTEAGNRAVPVSAMLLPRLRERVLATPAGGLVVTATMGGPLRYSTWLRRVWAPALQHTRELPPAPRPPGRTGPLPRNVEAWHYLADPQPTPHDLRHTYGTRLADENVPIHDIAALLGHGDLRSTQRYLNSREDRFDRARKALDRARGRQAEPPGPAGTATGKD